MRLLIPTIGSTITLTKEWKFLLYSEYRNASFERTLGGKVELAKAVFDEHYKGFSTSLPIGTVLVIDRIYIRKNQGDFDSLTFKIQDCPNEDLKKVRFWAKLKDVNNIEGDFDQATIPV